MAVDPIGEDNPIEEILLTGFPNPERTGCPSPDVINALGNRKLGRNDPAWHHIWSCSPCFSDFKIIRDARVAKLEEAEKHQRTRRKILTAAAVSSIAVVSGYLFVSETRSHAIPVVFIDLTDAVIVRGSGINEDAIVAQLPRKVDEIHLTLPRFSKVGRYVVAVLESKSERTAVALGSATAKGTEQHASVSVSLDLSEAKPGRYFLGIRLEENGQEGTPSYYPVQIYA